MSGKLKIKPFDKVKLTDNIEKKNIHRFIIPALAKNSSTTIKISVNKNLSC